MTTWLTDLFADPVLLVIFPLVFCIWDNSIDEYTYHSTHSTESPSKLLKYL